MNSGVSDNALLTLQEQIMQQRASLTDHINAGGCKDWAEYCSMTGQIKGLDMALRELIELNRRIENA